MVAPDDGWLCRQNIERFRRLRADEPDAALRAGLTLLIAEEQAKLDQLSADARGDPPPRDPGR
jgi:hypothetical protein